MDLSSVDKLRRLTQLSTSYFGPQNLVSEAHIRIAVVRLDRAIPFPEANDSVFKGPSLFQGSLTPKFEESKKKISREREVEVLFLPTPTTTQPDHPTPTRQPTP